MNKRVCLVILLLFFGIVCVGTGISVLAAEPGGSETEPHPAQGAEISCHYETVTLQLQQGKVTVKTLTYEADDIVQQVLEEYGITDIRWRLLSGEGLVAIVKTNAYQRGKASVKIRGKKAGTAKLLCYYMDDTGAERVLAQYTVEVLPRKTMLSFGKKKYIIPYQWHKRIVPAKAFNAAGKKLLVSYHSSNKKIARVDQTGKITGVKTGTTVITVKAKDGSGVTASFQVQVRREKAGWHKESSGRKYYVLKNGKRAFGYRKLGAAEYFFNKNSSYAVTRTWKYVTWYGKKYKIYFGRNGKRKIDVSGLMKKDTRYRLEVNLRTNIVMVYARDGKKGYIIPVKAMICSAGMKGHATITGTYSLSRAGRWHTLYYGTYGQYCSRISGPYLFHSVTYSRYGDKYSLQAKEYRKLGTSASHGCIRLQVKDAKWIYEHYSRCTAVLFYSNNKKTPIPRPKANKIGKAGKGRFFDPSDPAV